jgi:DNA-binding FadR family transcriptional regulator
MNISFSPGKVSDDAQRLASCIIGADDPTGNLAHEAVSVVEMHLLQRGWPVGEALGALPDVQKGLGLGRPACREAMIILEARGLLDVRRGPGGGLLVAAPTAVDVVGAMLMYLTISGASGDRIQEFRLLVWRMIVEAAIDRGAVGQATAVNAGEWGFAVDLARRIGNPAMALAAQIAEMLVRACEGRPAPSHDALLDRALTARDSRRALRRLDDLANPMDLAAPLLALEAMESSFAWSGRRSAMALASRIIREMIHRPDKLEAEWQTAERLGYSDAVVRQARRILQDFGVVRCQRGRKGALWGPPASPAGVIRLLAPCLIASGATPRDNAEAANALACTATRLAAGRAAECGRAQTKVLGSFANSLELVDQMRIENLLLELAGNPLLSIMTRSLGLANLQSLEPGICQQSRGDIVAFNQRILRTIEAGDADAAGLLARAKGQVIHQSEDRYRKLA